MEEVARSFHINQCHEELETVFNKKLRLFKNRNSKSSIVRTPNDNEVFSVQVENHKEYLAEQIVDMDIDDIDIDEPARLQRKKRKEQMNY